METIEDIEFSLREKCGLCKGTGCEPGCDPEQVHWCGMCAGSGLYYHYKLSGESTGWYEAMTKAEANYQKGLIPPWKL